MGVESRDELTPARADGLNAGGLIPQRQAGKITVRCRAPGGRLTADRLERVAQVARKYGNGLVHLSVRQSPEILYVDRDHLDAVVAELAEVGQEIAASGKRFRVSTACGGCEYNPNGWTDTQRLAQAATARFLGRDTPHKFKTCFAGCVRDCVRSREADLGFQGMVEPALIADRCTHCGLCVGACRDDALGMSEDDLPAPDPDRCISCGDCIKACPSEAMTVKRTGHAVYVGGKHGKHPHAAYPVAAFVTDEQALAVVQATLEWYQAHGARGERLGETLDREGIDSYRRVLHRIVGKGLLGSGDLHRPKWRRIFARGLAEEFPEYGDIAGDRG